MQVAYARYAAITIDDGQPFHRKVVALLDAIDALPLGTRLLQEIQASGKRIGIAPLRPGVDNGNKCVAQFRGKFVRLRQAFDLLDPNITLEDELSHTLAQAERAGMNRMALARLIVRGLTPATVRTVDNVVHPQLQLTRLQVNDESWRVARLIDDLANGRVGAGNVPRGQNGQYGLADKLIRLLRPWLRAGTGSNSGIYFDPDSQQSCCGELGMQWRPPGIGMAHELCHAWRNATGGRLFDDGQACGFDDDEVMTTGIPPYHTEKFSENLFRAAWPLSFFQRWWHWTNELPMRQSYR
jgi:hypothetical protein